VCSCTYAGVLHSDVSTTVIAISCTGKCISTIQSCCSFRQLTQRVHSLAANTDLHQRSRLHTHSAALRQLSCTEFHIVVLQYISAMNAAANGLHYEAAAVH
jgi:hypothetical protein